MTTTDDEETPVTDQTPTPPADTATGETLDDLASWLLHRLEWRHPHWPSEVRNEVRDLASNKLQIGYLLEEMPPELIERFGDPANVAADAEELAEMKSAVRQHDQAVRDSAEALLRHSAGVQ